MQALLIKAVMAFITKLGLAVFTEKIIAKASFASMKWLADKTTNEIDNKAVVEIRAAYYNEGSK